MKYRSHIDGLRGCAVLAVVLYHAGVEWMPGGFMGVDMFFVISGFLITGLLVREHETTGSISLAGFYERRLRRLGPALFVVLVVTLAMGAWLLSPVLGEQQGLAKSAIATVLLVSNHYFVGSVGGYFDDPAEAQPLLHTWSLSVEEQFYLVWPLMLLMVLGLARARRASPSWWLGAVLFGLFVTSFVASLWVTVHLPQWAFFATPFRAWEFAIGGLIFMLARQPAPSNSALPPLLAWVGFASLALGLLFVDESVPFPGYAALLPTLGTASWMLLGEWYGRSAWVRVLSTKWLVWMGLVSYSLYLWHWPLLSILRIHQLGEPQAWMIGATCLASLVLATATYRWVEQPVRSKQVPLMSNRRRAYLVGSLGSLGVLSLGIALGLGGKSAVASSSSLRALQVSLIEMRKVRVPCAQSAPYRGRFDGHPECGTDEVSIQTPAGVLLWGDSHAAHLAPAVRSVVDDMQLSLRIRYMPECPPALDFSPSLVGIDRREGCEQFNEDVLAEARNEAQRGLELVVLSAIWPSYVSNDRAAAQVLAGLRATVAQLHQAGLETVLVLPSPMFPYLVPSCLARRSVSECGVARSDAEARRSIAVDLLSKVGSGVEGTWMVDPFDALCASERCEPMIEERVLFSDRHHLSVAGTRMIEPGLARSIILALQRRRSGAEPHQPMFSSAE